MNDKNEKNDKQKQLKVLTVEDLARVVGGAEEEEESDGGETEYPQRKSRYPSAKTKGGLPGGGTIGGIGGIGGINDAFSPE